MSDGSHALRLGATVYDAEHGPEDGQAIVVERPGTIAAEYQVDAVNATVVGCNPGYPGEDPVVGIVFASALADRLGAIEKSVHVDVSNDAVDAFGPAFGRRVRSAARDDGATIYHYPESRLREWQPASAESE